MADLKAVYQRGVQNISAAYSQAISDYHMASAADDTDGAADAAMRMAGLQATYAQFDALARQAANPQQGAAPVNRYGLTAEETEVAKSFTADPKMTEDQKLQTYALQKQRYRALRDSGYRDELDAAGLRK